MSNQGSVLRISMLFRHCALRSNDEIKLRFRVRYSTENHIAGIANDSSFLIEYIQRERVHPVRTFLVPHRYILVIEGIDFSIIELQPLWICFLRTNLLYHHSHFPSRLLNVLCLVLSVKL